MFCPKCGNPEQTPNTYCRKCGEFLSENGKAMLSGFGEGSPQQNLQVINTLSLIAAVVSLFAGIWMYATKFSVPFVLYLAAAVLISNAVWHGTNFILGLKLKNRLNNARKNLSEKINELPAAETEKLLHGADFRNVVPNGVTENTTTSLDEVFVNKRQR